MVFFAYISFYQPYVGHNRQAKHVQSHQNPPKSPAAIATCEVKVSLSTLILYKRSFDTFYSQKQ